MKIGKQFQRQNYSGSESYCQQEYTTHRLVALRYKNWKKKNLEHYFRYKIILQVNKGKSVELAIDDFQFPSCCNCHLRL